MSGSFAFCSPVHFSRNALSPFIMVIPHQFCRIRSIQTPILTALTNPFAAFTVLCSIDHQPGEKNSSKPSFSTPISRRQVMQLLNAVLGVVTVAFLVKMKNQFRLISPQAILSSIGLSRLPSRTAVPIAQAANIQTSLHHQKALEYIQKIDAQPAIACPQFPTSADWIGSRPLSLTKQLKGKVVLLDFFTYCCINCQHVLPKLREMELKYGEDASAGFAVVGVHSAKFSAEKDTQNVAAAVERYDIRHPVINDDNMVMWNEIGVTSWPTLALVGPKGNLIAIWSGERQEQDIDHLVSAALEYYSDDIDHTPLPKPPKRIPALANRAPSPLRYPGKLTVSPEGKSIYVSDSGNNRILQVDLASKQVVRTFGGGEPALLDAADPSQAAFHSPQGLSVWRDVLYVADTESHAVRAVDLLSGRVETIGGNGEQGFDYVAGNVGKAQLLSSPWDVEVVNGVLYVAMAGTHQIWSLVLPENGNNRVYSNKWQVFSGSGRELEKNSSLGRTAGWAQPSHLSAASTGAMYVADSESSCVRAIDLDDSKHPTRTIAGGDGLLAENLFAFGDKEGRGARAKFQHPLAVCYDKRKDLVYVADSYNHRIKVVDNTGSAKVFCGNGSPGLLDGAAKQAMFWEPAGLSLSPDGSKLYVSDTNNGVIRVIDTESKNVSTIQISTSKKVSDGGSNGKLIPNRRRVVQVAFDAVNVKSMIKFSIAIPNKSHFTPGTTSRYQVNVKSVGISDGEAPLSVMLARGNITQSIGGLGSFMVDLSKDNIQVDDGKSLEVEAITYYCTADDVCRTEATVFEASISQSGSLSQTVMHTIVPRSKATMNQTGSRT